MQEKRLVKTKRIVSILFMNIFYNATAKQRVDETTEAIVLLDSLIAELDSVELVEKVAKALHKVDSNFTENVTWEGYIPDAEAAIRCVITATRDRE